MILKLNKHFNGFFDKISRAFIECDQEIKLIKNLGPIRGWFYSHYESDYPLINDDDNPDSGSGYLTIDFVLVESTSF